MLQIYKFIKNQKLMIDMLDFFFELNMAAA